MNKNNVYLGKINQIVKKLEINDIFGAEFCPLQVHLGSLQGRATSTIS